MANNMESSKSNGIKKAAIIGGIIVSVILIFGTMWMGRIAKKDTEDAVRSVSLLYLDALRPISKRRLIISRWQRVCLSLTICRT